MTVGVEDDLRRISFKRREDFEIKRVTLNDEEVSMTRVIVSILVTTL